MIWVARIRSPSHIFHWFQGFSKQSPLFWFQICRTESPVYACLLVSGTFRTSSGPKLFSMLGFQGIEYHEKKKSRRATRWKIGSTMGQFLIIWQTFYTSLLVVCLSVLVKYKNTKIPMLSNFSFVKLARCECLTTTHFAIACCWKSTSRRITIPPPPSPKFDINSQVTFGKNTLATSLYAWSPNNWQFK
jgi:hypothetical protein